MPRSPERCPHCGAPGPVPAELDRETPGDPPLVAVILAALLLVAAVLVAAFLALQTSLPILALGVAGAVTWWRRRPHHRPPVHYYCLECERPFTLDDAAESDGQDLNQ
jgi:hypothetical protein